MGVPKFFRYISERYPCLSQVIKEYQIPDFDNLYLDMNGIIHVCSHPNDFDPHFRISEEQIFKDIFHYIEILFRLIQPKKLFFMAVDGVAPRAKMNQQRGRRFRSAKEAEMLEKKAGARGEVLPEGKRFDSNCITPGTVFMARLQEQLKYFVTYKVSTDKIWQLPEIILSGHETPGEGEHKIMDYIRFLRSCEGWDPNTRHCLYGLDADLIMLGLCTHEIHFCLLREEVKFGKRNQKRISSPEETKFFLLHLSLLRDYLDLEFQALKTTLPFPYDIERIIDDWVLMGFLVGNDFIPNLPGLNIADGALHLLYQTYIEVLPKLGGYINDGGTLNLERFEAYLGKLSQFDFDQFKEIHGDMKYFESKTGRKLLGVSPNFEGANDELRDLIESTNSALENGCKEGELDDSGDESDLDTSDDDLLKAEFSQFKKDYYMNKLEYRQVTLEVLTSQAEGYVRAIQWNLHYYYNGCPSWSWFYPHHYSPYISDIKGFSNLKIEFEVGRPFLPFQQLLAVLPSASKELLPSALQKLMVEEDSPLIEFYPKDFEVDMNGKKQEWEGVVLVPFIDQDCLLSAMEPCYEQLTEEEKKRNTHGPMHIYKYTPVNLGVYDGSGMFARVDENHAEVREVWSSEICIEPRKLVKGLYPGTKPSSIIGFPTLAHLQFKAKLKKNKVKVFEQSSRNESMVLSVLKPESKSLEEVASSLVGQCVLVGWPHLLPAKVSSVSNGKVTIRLEKGFSSTERSIVTLSNSEQSSFNMTRTGVDVLHKSRLGIELGELQVLVYAHPLEGTAYTFNDSGQATLGQVWSSLAVEYPLQTTLQDVSLCSKMASLVSTDPVDIATIFPTGATVFIVSTSSGFYGTQGMVVEGPKKPGFIKVQISVTSEPNLSSVYSVTLHHKKHYMPGSVAAQRVGLGAHLWSRITGTIFVLSSHPNSEKVNIGLNLKFNKKNEELLGYTKKDGNMWLYSDDAVGLVARYVDKFPELFTHLGHKTGDDIFQLDEIFPDKGEEQLASIVGWLRSESHAEAERRVCGVEAVEEEGIRELERVVSEHEASEHVKQFSMHMKPQHLYKPKPQLGQLMPDPSATHKIMDRIVVVRESYVIPLGTKGTIIAIDRKDDGESTVYDVLFDVCFVGGLKLGTESGRCYRMTSHAFINMSHGIRVRGSSPVSEFFSAYKSKKEMMKGSEEVQAQPQAMTANREFQAMWNELQSQKLEPSQMLNSFKAQPPQQQEQTQPGSAAVVSQQTHALKKFLKIENSAQAPVKTDNPQMNARQNAPINQPSYCSYLSTLCQRMGIALPVYKYTGGNNMMMGLITCSIKFPGMQREVIGPPEKDKLQAAESAACIAAQMLQQGQGQLCGGGMRMGGPPGFMAAPLPTPPQQWYQHKPEMNQGPLQMPWKPREAPLTRTVMSRGVNQFVPLQVQRRGKQGAQQQPPPQPQHTLPPQQKPQLQLKVEPPAGKPSSKIVPAAPPTPSTSEANPLKVESPPEERRRTNGEGKEEEEVGVGGKGSGKKPGKARLRSRLAAKFHSPVNTH